VSGVPLGTQNAGDTVHRGLELGISAPLGARLSGRLNYTYQDFSFDDDPVFDDNAIAGAPEHVIDARLSLEVLPRITVEPTLYWQPEATPADNANTRFQDDFYLLGLQLRYQSADGALRVYLDGRNLTDENYASATLITDVANPTQALFLPGDGRAVYAGIEWRI
jgi:iron complex outermembrane receptor protein